MWLVGLGGRGEERGRDADGRRARAAIGCGLDLEHVEHGMCKNCARSEERSDFEIVTLFTVLTLGVRLGAPLGSCSRFPGGASVSPTGYHRFHTPHEREGA